MGALLVDQVTSVYIVVAVAFAIFGGIYAYLWRLAGQAGKPGGTGAGIVAMVLLWLVFAALGLGGVIRSVDTLLLVAAAAVLAVWLLIFYSLWRLDRSSGS